MKRLRPRTQPRGARTAARTAARLDSAAPPLPAETVGALARWWLFNDVPLPLLVPDPQLTPLESLRLFYIDPIWQRSLLAGAFSVGRSSTDQLTVDAAALTAALPAINTAAAPTAPALFTGCLLHSGVVKGWPTMRIVAADKDGAPVPIARREQLTDTLLLVLFAGVAQTIVFSEPAEAVHFGLDLAVTEGSPPIKSARAVTGANAGNPLGVSIDVDNTHQQLLRSADVLN